MDKYLNDIFPQEYKGFYYRKINDSLIINSTDFDGAIKVMREDGIRNLEINPNYKKYEELSFLSKFNFIEGISILPGAVGNISGINQLSSLKSLTLQERFYGVVEFSSFTNLKSCSMVWGIDGCETIYKNATIKRLSIVNYPKPDLVELAGISSLEELSILASKIVTILGIEKFQSLHSIDLSNNIRLENIHQISLLKCLERLRIDGCKNIKDLTPIGKATNLKFLSFSDLGNISNLEFLNTLQLEEVFFTGKTNVIDGNLSYLHALFNKGILKNAIFPNKKHYSHKREELGYKPPIL
jgi:Leucine-rich repeat (LRR) protein